MLGREVNVPLRMMLGEQTDLSSDAHEYLRNSEKAITNAQCEARASLKQSHYEVGDIVYLIYSSAKVKDSKKLRPIYIGPYLAINVLSPILFKIKNKKREFVVHHDRIKPFNDKNCLVGSKRCEMNS